MSPSPSSSPSPTLTSTAVAHSDIFGYQALSAPFQWVDISPGGSPGGGTLLNSWCPAADDGSITQNLPHGHEASISTARLTTKVAIASNGYLQFGVSSSNFGNNCLSVNTSPLNIVSLYWMDLNPGLATGNGGVYYGVLNPGSPGNRIIVIQFQAIPLHSGAGSLTAEALLFEADNHISLRYLDASDTGAGLAAVSGLRSGFQCPNQTSLPITCNQALIGDQSQIDISYPSPEPACGTPTLTPTPSVSQTWSSTPSATPTLTLTPSYSQTPTASPSSTITASFSASPTFSYSPTITLTGTISPTFTASPTF